MRTDISQAALHSISCQSSYAPVCSRLPNTLSPRYLGLALDVPLQARGSLLAWGPRGPGHVSGEEELVRSPQGCTLGWPSFHDDIALSARRQRGSGMSVQTAPNGSTPLGSR